MSPEQQARQVIDRLLSEAGWLVQDYKSFNPGEGLGIAVREYPTDTGPADYALFIERKPVGVIEAKPAGTILTPVEEQAERYAKGELKWFVKQNELPFMYLSTGDETRFTDSRDPNPRPRGVFGFHQPNTLRERLLEDKTLRARFYDIPPLDPEGLRDCQFNAITNLEKSLCENRPRALVQMATGAGKTYTAINSVYRLLKFAKAKRILFLVDTRNLGIQAEQEFQAFKPKDDPRLFTELYNVQRLTGGFVDDDAQVCISTIQRMYSMLTNKEIDELLEDKHLDEAIRGIDFNKEVTYNFAFPIETFDLIIIDECHRSIYNLWKQVLDYFDAFYVGLTATPDARTYGFFHQNLVSEYDYETSIIDGVNVGFDVYRIKTQVTEDGGLIEAGEWVDKRSRTTRAKRWEQLEDELEFERNSLDRDVVIPSQIRTVIKEFKRVLPSLFPDRFIQREGHEALQFEVPKTLVFAKTDSHADDIIKIIREEFAESADFCKKITHNADNPSQLLQSFRNDYYPRISVTVDMIATGTDVKALEILVFMRDVKSLNYFEQMKGRGVRTISDDKLRQVSSAARTKDHFVIIDAVGVTESEKSVMRALERKKGVSFDLLLTQVAFGVRDEDTLQSLANRIIRLDREISAEERAQISKLTDGKPPSELARELLRAYSPDAWIEEAKAADATLGEDVSPETSEAAKDRLVDRACRPFDNPALREKLTTLRKQHDQIIHDGTIDQVIFSGPVTEQAEKTILTFKEFLKEHKDDIAALHIFYDQPLKRRKLTYDMAKELAQKLQEPPYALTSERLWQAYKTIEGSRVRGDEIRRTLSDVVSLLRHELEPTEHLTPFREEVEARFAMWLEKENASGKTYTKEQIQWLTMVKDRIATQLDIEKEDLEFAPFVNFGGLAKAHQLFGPQFEEAFESLEQELVTV